MSLIKEVEELDSALKALLLSIVLMPFWYVSIYLFKNSFYQSADLIIVIIMCFVLSTSSSFLLSATGLWEQDEKLRAGHTVFTDMILSVTILATWLTFLIFILYSLKYYFNIVINFYYLVILYYTIILLVHLYEIFVQNYTKKNRKNN